MEIESVVGPLQSAAAGDVDAAEFLARYRAARESIAASVPAWLNQDLIARAAKRLRQLQGRWRATPFGQTMELRFEV